MLSDLQEVEALQGCITLVKFAAATTFNLGADAAGAVFLYSSRWQALLHWRLFSSEEE